MVILLLNLLIAMMGDTYAKIAEIKNEWMRQVIVEQDQSVNAWMPQVVMINMKLVIMI